MQKMNTILRSLLLFSSIFLIPGCGSVNKPYNYKRFPDSFSKIQHDYENYYYLNSCQPGETIASIGAGNGLIEIHISCFIEPINWYLQEIDSSRLFEFEQVLTYHENLIGSSIKGSFNLVLGNEDTTGLAHGIFDRVLMLNVFHEIDSREGIMMEIHQLLNEGGMLVVMERVGKSEGELHGDCGFPKLFEPAFLREMDHYGYDLKTVELGEEVSNLRFYSFESRK